MYTIDRRLASASIRTCKGKEEEEGEGGGGSVLSRWERQTRRASHPLRPRMHLLRRHLLLELQLDVCVRRLDLLAVAFRMGQVHRPLHLELTHLVEGFLLVVGGVPADDQHEEEREKRRGEHPDAKPHPADVVRRLEAHRHRDRVRAVGIEHIERLKVVLR